MDKPCDRCKKPTDGVFQHANYATNWWAIFYGARTVLTETKVTKTFRFSRLRWSHDNPSGSSNTYTDYQFCSECWSALSDFLCGTPTEGVEK